MTVVPYIKRLFGMTFGFVSGTKVMAAGFSKLVSGIIRRKLHTDLNMIKHNNN
jgi:hypothetical protein